MKVSNKKNLYVADEDLQWFDKVKVLYPGESLSKLIAEALKEKCLLKEAEQKSMTECKVYRGKFDKCDDVFIGEEFRFFGVMIASGLNSQDEDVKVYLTKRGKFLVYAERDDVSGFVYMSFREPYGSFSELSANLTSKLLGQCSEYLNLNSTVRTYQVLDI